MTIVIDNSLPVYDTTTRWK